MLTRIATQGPELDVVRAFLEQGIFSDPADTTVSVFSEPKLETGYPDIVVVHWLRRTAEAWPSHRAELSTEDMRLVHFIGTVRGVARDEFRKRCSERTLERIHAAGVVRVTSRSVRLRPLREIFAVRRIIALEAKISNWRRGLQQAFANTWFASESYLLLPRIPNGSAVVDRAQEMGIGLVRTDQKLSTPQVRPRRDRLPQSYASWLFNEWAWRGLGASTS